MDDAQRAAEVLREIGWIGAGSKRAAEAIAAAIGAARQDEWEVAYRRGRQDEWAETQRLAARNADV